MLLHIDDDWPLLITSSVSAPQEYINNTWYKEEEYWINIRKV